MQGSSDGVADVGDLVSCDMKDVVGGQGMQIVPVVPGNRIAG